MSIDSIGSVSSSVSAQAALQEAQRKLATDVAAKATDKVIAADKAAVAKSEKEATRQRQTTGTVDIDL